MDSDDTEPPNSQVADDAEETDSDAEPVSVKIESNRMFAYRNLLNDFHHSRDYLHCEEVLKRVAEGTLNDLSYTWIWKGIKTNASQSVSTNIKLSISKERNITIETGLWGELSSLNNYRPKKEHQVDPSFQFLTPENTPQAHEGDFGSDVRFAAVPNHNQAASSLLVSHTYSASKPKKQVATFSDGSSSSDNSLHEEPSPVPLMSRKRHLPMFPNSVKTQKSNSGSAISMSSNVTQFHGGQFSLPFCREEYQIRVLQCFICNSSMQSELELKDHLSQLHHVSEHRCPVDSCKHRSFMLRQELNRHFITEHPDNGRVMCCGEVFTPDLLKAHQQYRHHKGHFQCTRCYFIAPTRADAHEHFQAKHIKFPIAGAPMAVNSKYMIKSLKCSRDSCSESFLRYEHLYEHQKMVHSWAEYLVECPICNQHFDMIKEHIAADHGAGPWNCRRCGAQLDSIGSLMDHQKMYHQMGQFQCTYKFFVEQALWPCKFIGSTRAQVIDHYNKNHLPTSTSSRTKEYLNC